MRYAVFSCSDCPVLNISSIGYSYDASVTRFGPSVRNLFIIHYVIQGKGYFNNNAVSAGEGFLITPGTFEHYYPDHQNPWEFLWIISDDLKMAKLLDYFNANKQTGIFKYNYVDVIKDFSKFIVESNNSRFGGFEMLENFIKMFKFQQEEKNPKTYTSNAKIYIKAAEKFIESNIQNPLHVSELIHFLGVTQPYLFKIFKQHLSLSPKQFIMEKKLNRAKLLLLQTDLSVSQISNSVGFFDALSFSKYFKQKMGLSPKNYRNKYKNEA